MATIGIDIGGSKLLTVRVDAGRTTYAERTALPEGSSDLPAAVADAARAAWSDEVTGVGIGVAGLVRWPEGTFVWGPHVAGIEVALRSDAEAALGVPVVVDNDANTAAYAEMRSGSGAGYRNVLLVTLGTGIGGAIVIDGSVYRGESFAGEWGHMVVHADGLLCDCGKNGCWETVASGPALVRLAREAIALNPDSSFARRVGDRPTGEDITAAADAGDELARGLVAQVGAQFGRGLASLIAIFDPEAIIVGGGLGSIGESIIGPARRVVTDAIHGGSYRLVPPILVAGLGPRAGAIGAAMMMQAVHDGTIPLEP